MNGIRCRIVFLFFVYWLCVPAVSGQKAVPPPPEAGFEVSLLDARSLLIWDAAIRRDLKLSGLQTKELGQLCDGLNDLLFSLRDAPPYTTDEAVLRAIGQIDQRLKTLSQILNAAQLERLGQLRLQYEGVRILFRPEIERKLELTNSQRQRIRKIHRMTLKLQAAAAESEEDPVPQIQKIQHRELQQIISTLNDSQRQCWRDMLGEPFDFSQVHPVFFQAPELREVTAWMNTEPLSLESLRGKVVIVHFWTFGCVNCVHNYPAYKRWMEQYSPAKVVMLGIHTPESEGEKDVQALREKVRTEGLTFPVVVDNGKANWDAWSNRIWPSVYLIDKAGRVRYWWYGELNWQGATGEAWMSRCIEELMAEKLQAATNQ